jgi:preprotein translocase subunit YajC
MKKNVRQALAISGLAIALGTTGITLDANAYTGTQNYTRSSHQERILRSRKSENAKNHFGMHGIIVSTVTAINSDSLTVKSDSKKYTVNISSNTRILNKKWEKINLSNIQEGDKIKIAGNISDTIIAANTIRDISL